ncbi:MAG: DUF4430 domain-containing protein [Clostridia bacterium]|nr:DUF4430 domain-containing protein [Clostridia bacterium]
MKKLLTAALLCVLLLLLCACGGRETAQTVTLPQSEIAAAETVGVGQTAFTFTVVDADGNTTAFTVRTDKQTVGEALTDAGLIAGDVGAYGLYVKTVNGIRADYEKDGCYWAFYIDGEMAMTGVDSTDVVAGSTYTFKIEK